MNSIILSGRLVKDIEVKQSNSGSAYTRFTLAVDKIGKDKQKGTNYIDCVAFNHSANFLGKYAHKGSKVYVSGELDVSTKEYEDGTKRTFYTVIANQVEADTPKQNNNSNEMPFEL